MSIIKSSFVIYSRLIINIFIGLYSSRLILDNLGVTNYGLYNVVSTLIISISIINTILLNSTNRYLGIEIGKKYGNLKKMFSISYTLHFIVAFIVVFLSQLIGYFWINNYLNYDGEKFIVYLIFNLSLISTFFSIISVPFISLQTANEDFKFNSNLSTLQSIIVLFISIFISFISNKLIVYSSLICIIYSCISIANIIYTIKRYEDSSLRFLIKKKEIKKMLTYSGWMGIGAVAYMLKNQGNSILLNLFFGTKLNASFGIANQVNQQVSGLTYTLNRIFVPRIMKDEGKKDFQNQIYTAVLSSKILFYACLLICFPVILFTENILHFWLNDYPDYTSIFIKLLLVDLLLTLINNGISNLIFARGEVKNYQIVINLLNILNLPITYFLFKSGYSPEILVVTSICFTILSNLLKVYFAKKILGIDLIYLYNEIYKYILRILIVCMLICYQIDGLEISVLGVIVYLVFIELTLLLSILVLGLSNNEKSIFLNKIKNEKIKALLLKIVKLYK